ncbi:acylphosphatase [Nocardioides lentus]|uniref:acylphosphatase n=1 Tax=Nocardioides lentus TaxID=338077 RepID=UPI0031CF014C
MRIIVTGRVQGVSYRWATEQEATRLGLDGWVRNEPDGSVLAYAVGPRDAVDALVAWCHEGPPAARVAGVDATDVDPREGVGREVREGGGFRTLG